MKKSSWYLMTFYDLYRYNFIYCFEINTSDQLGIVPSTSQYIDGFSWSQIYNFPKSSTDWFLMHKNIPGAWQEPILIVLFPAGCGTQSWLELPVLDHWITGDPPSVLSLAISSTSPFNKLWIKKPLPDLTNLHLWLNLLWSLNWMILVSG